MKRLLPLLLILPLAGFRPAPMPPPAYEGGPVRMSLVDRDPGFPPPSSTSRECESAGLVPFPNHKRQTIAGKLGGVEKWRASSIPVAVL